MDSSKGNKKNVYKSETATQKVILMKGLLIFSVLLIEEIKSWPFSDGLNQFLEFDIQNPKVWYLARDSILSHML